MTNVIHLNPKRKYDSLPERELESLWENISGKDIRNLNRNLIKAIAKNEDKVQTKEIPLQAKQMFDSEKAEFVPFDIWGAHYIVNVKKETLVMRIYLPLPYQNEGGEVLKAWTRYDCAHLQESLDETGKNTMNAGEWCKKYLIAPPVYNHINIGSI